MLHYHHQVRTSKSLPVHPTRPTSLHAIILPKQQGRRNNFHLSRCDPHGGEHITVAGSTITNTLHNSQTHVQRNLPSVSSNPRLIFPCQLPNLNYGIKATEFASTSHATTGSGSTEPLVDVGPRSSHYREHCLNQGPRVNQQQYTNTEDHLQSSITYGNQNNLQSDLHKSYLSIDLRSNAPDQTL